MMTVRNNDELKLFLDTIDQCEKVMSSEVSPELEVYARNREDVAKLFHYMESIGCAA